MSQILFQFDTNISDLKSISFSSFECSSCIQSLLIDCLLFFFFFFCRAKLDYHTSKRQRQQQRIEDEKKISPISAGNFIQHLCTSCEQIKRKNQQQFVQQKIENDDQFIMKDVFSFISKTDVIHLNENGL